MLRSDIFKKCFIAKIAKESDSHVILTSNYYDTQNIKPYIEDDFNIIHVDDEK